MKRALLLVCSLILLTSACSSTTTTTAETSVPPLAASPSTTATTAPPATTATPAGYVPPPATLVDCRAGTPADYRCYTVRVLVDPTRPDGATLKLAVTTRRVDPARWTSPVLSLCSCAENHYVAGPLPPTFYAGHDVVWVDGRGTGLSDGTVDCPELRKIPGQLGSGNVTASGLAAIKACFAKAAGSSVPLASVLDHDVAAADIIATRRALGIDRWAVNTVAAGADIAARLAGTDQDATTALVVRVPQAVGHGMTPDTVNKAFESLVADCAASVSCAKAGDPHAGLATVLGRPSVTTNVTDGDGSPVVLDKLSAQLGIAGAMANSGLAPIVPMLLAGPDDGGTAAARAFVANGYPDPSAASVASFCQDVDYVFPGTVRTADSRGGGWVGMSYKHLCDDIGPVPQMRPLADVTSRTPVLVVLPTYDGRSDVDTARAIFHGFTNLTVLAIPHVADPTAQLPCFNAMRTSFVEHPDAKADTSCADSSTVKTFP